MIISPTLLLRKHQLQERARNTKADMRPHREALQAGWRDSIQVGEASRSTASCGHGDQVLRVLGAEGGAGDYLGSRGSL